MQTDNRQPFYVKLDKVVYSSSYTGYLVISKLKAGSYDLIIGFPKNQWPEQSLHFTVEDKDLGYLLKNFGDKGWGFFNLQTQAVLMPVNNEKKKTDNVFNVKDDAFSNMLAVVVNDSTIKQTELVKEDIKKPVIEETKIASLTASEPPKASVVEAPINEPVVPGIVVSKGENKKTDTIETNVIPILVSEPAKPGVAEVPKVAPVADAVVISKKLSKKTAKGMEIVYLETGGGQQDTINVFIPADDEIVQSKQVNPAEENKVKEDVNTKQLEPVQHEETKKEAKFLAIDLPNPNSTVNEVTADTAIKQSTPKVAVINSECKNFATDEDFLKLRKKMAAAENADDMISIAKKVFKTKCFTTEQVKNLSVLFLSDNGKYDFFDASYAYVSDSKNFETLESQLTDGYYINRFKVMIRH